MNVTKYYALAEAVDPLEVEIRCIQFLSQYHPGAIWVSCPELGFESPSLLYCRYGLSIPYINIKKGTKVWIEPTINGSERWIVTGFADSPVDPSLGLNERLLIPLESGHIKINCGEVLSIEGNSDTQEFTVKVGAVEVSVNGMSREVKIGNGTESYVLGDTAKIELEKDRDALQALQMGISAWVPVPQDGGAALKAALANFLASPMARYEMMLSKVIKGE